MNKTELLPVEIAINTSEYQLVSSTIKMIGIAKAIDNLVIDIVGPLNARERWELFEDAEFPKNFRRHLKTVGTASDLSMSLVYPAIDWGYPADILLLELVGVENIQVESFDNTRMAEAISKLKVMHNEQPESIQTTMRRHENSR